MLHHQLILLDKGGFTSQNNKNIMILPNIYSQNTKRGCIFIHPLEDKKLYQAGKEIPLPFALIPWGQHIEIISQCKSIEEVFLYRTHVTRGSSRPWGVIMGAQSWILSIFMDSSNKNLLGS